jgi:hypothetical protein
MWTRRRYPCAGRSAGRSAPSPRSCGERALAASWMVDRPVPRHPCVTRAEFLSERRNNRPRFGFPFLNRWFEDLCLGHRLRAFSSRTGYSSLESSCTIKRSSRITSKFFLPPGRSQPSRRSIRQFAWRKDPPNRPCGRSVKSVRLFR